MARSYPPLREIKARSRPVSALGIGRAVSSLTAAAYMKKCPFCAEEIQEEAVKCKHCMEFLDESKRPVALTPPPFQHQKDDSLAWYFKTPFIVMMFCTLPPLAMPSVWLHPKLHIVWKLVITVAVVGVCWASVLAVQALLSQLQEATKMFNEMKF